MAQKKEQEETRETPPLQYIALGRRSEPFGVVEEGQKTTLPGFTAEQIAFVLHKAYYWPDGDLPEDVCIALDALGGG